MSSPFDPTVFLNTTYTESTSTERVLVPAGEWEANIDDVKARQWQSKDQSQAGMALDVVFAIDNEEVRKLLGRPVVKLTMGIMLDLTESGGLDFAKGRNVQLGLLRECTGCNVPGQPWSPPMFIGRRVKIVVSHAPDKNGVPRENVKAFVKL